MGHLYSLKKKRFAKGRKVKNYNERLCDLSSKFVDLPRFGVSWKMEISRRRKESSLRGERYPN